MSRRRLPTRLVAGLAMAVLAAAAAWAEPASAQASRVQTRFSHTLGASTVFGAAHTQACGAAAQSGIATEEALNHCTEALEAERPSRSMAEDLLVNRGAIRLRRHEGEAALADFNGAIELNPRNAEAYVNRGAALVMMGQPGPAVAAITHAISLRVASPHKAYYNRAAAREALGDLRGAYEDYSTALAIEPDWGPAEAELARFTRSRRDTIASRLAEAGQAGDRASARRETSDAETATELTQEQDEPSPPELESTP